MIKLRRATPDDAPGVAEVFLRSFHATYDFPLAHADDEVRAWVRDRLVPQMETWVAVDDAEPERVLGFATVEPGRLAQLYVDPDRLSEGIGRRLLEKAKERQPGGLHLWTFQVNDRAKRFYECNGFEVVRLGDESNLEERQRDGLYAWRPAR